MKNVLVVFVEVTQYNLSRIHNVYETIKDISFRYMYCHRSVSGHTTNETIPSNAVIIDECDSHYLSIMSGGEWDFFIINGYTEPYCLKTILYAKGRGIPYAIETDTQLNIPRSIIKRTVKSFLLKYIFSGRAFGFAGGSLQKKNFSYYGMDNKRIYIMPMTVDVVKFATIASQNNKGAYKSKYGLADKKVIMFAGRFVPDKDVMTLLEAALVLRKKISDFSLILL